MEDILIFGKSETIIDSINNGFKFKDTVHKIYVPCNECYNGEIYNSKNYDKDYIRNKVIEILDHKYKVINILDHIHYCDSMIKINNIPLHEIVQQIGRGSTNCDNPTTSREIDVKYCGTEIKMKCGNTTGESFYLPHIEQPY